eukprot:CAMPEP_0174317498 /NCGR_PEP_ID=MMETSP0810-20121108/7616_1 /TAXON_ID=73025 ORGANISM="Eutreptiella gymnastica-like, Strain CCMP1594" /NCGR_SAMPLE_ID=MMETSP0810 /ASSEMBLY_ACC=CAM_ASM_000659 /LENGTH=57 /DNA_ID=CAMNT_0015427483 /DNA_START=1479 /DNA_END=1652 /DNA_ORIENTATION=-
MVPVPSIILHDPTVAAPEGAASGCELLLVDVFLVASGGSTFMTRNSETAVLLSATAM